MENHSDISKNFIPYDLALELKDLGFNEECFAWYNMSQDNLCFFGDDCCADMYAGEESRPEAPLWQQAFRWFREKYDLTWEHQFNDSNISLYVGEITYPDNSLEFFKNINVEYDGYNKAYEEAELECLKKLIELFKEQK